MQARDDMATSVSFYGIIKDHHDALLLITAARFGLIPRFRRRLNMAEQDALVYSGSVFLWTEEESCMKRWTDGYPWSPSRIHHEFLLYREMAERGCARSRTTSRLAANDNNDESLRPYDDRLRKTIRLLAGSLFNNNELESLARLSTSGAPQADDIFKRGGLMKKTFSLSLPGETWHVVSYYTLEDALTFLLPTPQESPSLRGLSVSEDLQNYHALSLRRQSLGTSNQDSPKTLTFPQHISPHLSHPCPLPQSLSAVGSGTSNAAGWLNMLPVGNPPPRQPLLLPHTYTPRSGDDRHHIVMDDTTSGWYNFT